MRRGEVTRYFLQSEQTCRPRRALTTVRASDYWGGRGGILWPRARTLTAGGVAALLLALVGAEAEVPYTAEYDFYRARD
jgi:hypothetical protein